MEIDSPFPYDPAIGTGLAGSGPAERSKVMGQRQATPCIHRWVLGEPRMRTVPGVCRRCGARRTYPSGLEIPEAVPNYEELDRSRPVRSTEIASREEHSLV